MLDFTSALYLGLHHSSSSLRPWTRLTTGAPAALVEPAEVRSIAQALAGLMGCETATLGASTLHLAWDLFGLLAEKRITIFMDAEAYPITRWGVQRAAMRGAIVRTFPHQDVTALKHDFAAAPRDRTPVIVTDGVCPNDGRVAPLAEYAAMAHGRNGLLVIDDTQAFGILGHSPGAQMPYGLGGGGALRWCGIKSPNALVLASLAKGFGAPMAVLAGSRTRLREFEQKSLTRVHCSPPSIAALRAAEQAVLRNHREGDALRARLLESVRRFRRGVRRAHGFRTGRGLFPMQTVRPLSQMTPAELHGRLLERDIKTVLRRSKNGSPRVSFLITAAHTPQQIDHAVSVLAGILAIQPTETRANYHEDLVA